MAPAIMIKWGYSQSSSKWSILAIPPLSLFLLLSPIARYMPRGHFPFALGFIFTRLSD
jgi:hypothetical protein